MNTHLRLGKPAMGVKRLASLIARDLTPQDLIDAVTYISAPNPAFRTDLAQELVVIQRQRQDGVEFVSTPPEPDRRVKQEQLGG